MTFELIVVCNYFLHTLRYVTLLFRPTFICAYHSKVKYNYCYPLDMIQSGKRKEDATLLFIGTKNKASETDYPDCQIHYIKYNITRIDSICSSIERLHRPGRTPYRGLKWLVSSVCCIKSFRCQTTDTYLYIFYITHDTYPIYLFVYYFISLLRLFFIFILSSLTRE